MICQILQSCMYQVSPDINCLPGHGESDSRISAGEAATCTGLSMLHRCTPSGAPNRDMGEMTWRYGASTNGATNGATPKSNGWWTQWTILAFMDDLFCPISGKLHLMESRDGDMG